MVIIKRSEIQNLLIQHHEGTFGFSKTADVIRKLQTFLNLDAANSAGDATNDALDQNELYELALILLMREKSTRWFGNSKPTKSEVLAKTLEDKFGDGKFQLLNEYFAKNSRRLTKAVFNRIVLDAVAENDQLNPSAAVQSADVNLLDESRNPTPPITITCH